MNYLDQFLLHMALCRPVRYTSKVIGEIRRAGDRMMYNLVMDGARDSARKSAGARKPRPKVEERHAAVKAIHDSIKAKMTIESEASLVRARMPLSMKLGKRQIERILAGLRKSDTS
jgi:hypothetical protein